jgi:hypothetical protein
MDVGDRSPPFHSLTRSPSFNKKEKMFWSCLHRYEEKRTQYGTLGNTRYKSTGEFKESRMQILRIGKKWCGKNIYYPPLNFIIGRISQQTAMYAKHSPSCLHTRLILLEFVFTANKTRENDRFLLSHATLKYACGRK